MWIKICANTNLDDAQLAAELGADAVGFVFAPSVRRVTAQQVARITPHLLPAVERVGVFHAMDAAEIAETVRIAGLNTIQLHGGANPDLPRELNDIFQGKVRIIQTIHWQVDAVSTAVTTTASAATVAQQLREIDNDGEIDRVLIDTKVGQSTGGTGVAFDWAKARPVIADNAGALKVIVAGGLRPDNVAEAIRGLNPWGVDVASGVESVPASKSPEKLAAFIANARR